MILLCSDVSKEFDGNIILKNCSFKLEVGEKAAITGINGAGKSTLMKIIAGELSPDSGRVSVSKGTSVGYLAQYQDITGCNTIYDEMLSAKKEITDLEEGMRKLEPELKNMSGASLDKALSDYAAMTQRFELLGGYSYKSEITGVLKGLGFDEDFYARRTDTLSGGQKTRVSLGKILLTKPDIILLDEPTNHLDTESVIWLENFLSGYTKTILIVSHDRYFIDKVASGIIEIENGHATYFSGSYSEYAIKKEAVRAAEIKSYYKQQQEIARQEQIIEKLRSFNREKSVKRAESREKMLNKIERQEKPAQLNDSMRIKLEPRIMSGNDVMSADGLTKSYSAPLFADINFNIKRGERVALTGGNGVGKTTILKIINGIVNADSGIIKTGSNVLIGYYDQEHNVLNQDKSIFDEISDAYPGLTNTEIRNVLAAFLFSGDDVFKLIGELSGGERGRVSLAKLMLSGANFLILDEPTNHLDMRSEEILENALLSYTGTILFVSHDRYFINRIATRILDLENRTLTEYKGNYDFYAEKKLSVNKTPEHAKEEKTAASGTKAKWQASREEVARERKKQNDIKRIENEIMEIEDEITGLDMKLDNPAVYSDPAKCLEIHENREKLKDRLDALYEKYCKINI